MSPLTEVFSPWILNQKAIASFQEGGQGDVLV